MAVKGPVQQLISFFHEQELIGIVLDSHSSKSSKSRHRLVFLLIDVEFEQRGFSL